MRVSSHLQGAHSLTFHVDDQSYMMVGKEKFVLKQFHIHTGSENRINGEQYAVEMHKVHRKEFGSKYAVIGIMFKEVADNYAHTYKGEMKNKVDASVAAWKKIIDLFGFQLSQGQNTKTTTRRRLNALDVTPTKKKVHAQNSGAGMTLKDNWLTHLPDGWLPLDKEGYELDTFMSQLDPLRYWSYMGSLTTP